MLNDIISFTAIVAVLTAIIKGISLVKKPNIEKKLLEDEQKVALHIFQFIIATIIFTFLAIFIIEAFTGDKLLNYKNDVAEFSKILFSLLLLGLMSAYTFYLIYSLIMIFSKNYYIEHKIHGKLFLIKPINSDRILLSNLDYNSENTHWIILKKDEVFEYIIYKDKIHKNKRKKK